MSISNLDEEPEILENPDRPEDDDDSHSEDSSEGEEEEYEDDERTFKKKLKKKFDRILKELETGSLDLQDESRVKVFITDFLPILDKKCIPKDQTLLHLLAESDKEDLPVKKIKNLVTALVQLPGINLLAEGDIDGKTPLFCAISMRNHRLVKAMCEAHKDIDSVLKITKGQGNQGSNCLHQAIINKSSSKDDDLAEFLIQRSGGETLCAVDDNGMTPLMLAVEYKRCDDAQPGIVRALVERCDKALDMSYTHKGKITLSPYRWHEHTYQDAMEKQERDATEAKKKADRVDAESLERATITGPESKTASKSTPRDGPKPQPNIPDIPLPQALRRVPTIIEAPTGKFGSGAGRTAVDSLSRKPQVAIPGIEGTAKGSLMTPILKGRINEVKKKRPKKSRSRTQPKEASAQEIKRFLKLYYLRKKNHDEAAEFLYGVQQDRQIYFDLVGGDSKLSERTIGETWHHLIFEDVLQYVAIPQVRVEANPVVVSSGKRSSKQDGNGRTDLQILFKWLKENRGVKTILKVIVDDLQEPAHSDEAIEACLTGMGVETWDWQKTDVCSEVIQKVSPDASVVHLYWSGNNAVLRGWSEAEGLKKLKKLRKIHLYVQQGLESRSRRKEYVMAFKKRMEAGSNIEVVERKMKGEINEGISGPMDTVRDPFERHKWMSTMEDFAEFLRTAEGAAEPKVSLKHDITVALIDDGVDINDQTIQSKIAGGRSFCKRDKEENLNQPYYVSGGGHGTAMAGLICKVCPNARLYILKLNEFFIEQGLRQITAESAAKAVRAAIDKKVDIISMSWTIEKTDANKDAIADLEKAIELAASQNILMFCAATDQGAYTDRSYPAASGTKRIFKIGAAEASGAAMKWLGDQALIDFTLPGHNVVMQPRGDPRVKQYTALTGSSVATALAAGLAAVMLYCVQIGCIKKSRPNLDKFQDLKSHERMQQALRQIGTAKESDNRYITVWNRFELAKIIKRPQGELRDTWLDCVADWALDDLMRED